MNEHLGEMGIIFRPKMLIKMSIILKDCKGIIE